LTNFSNLTTGKSHFMIVFDIQMTGIPPCIDVGDAVDKPDHLMKAATTIGMLI